MDLRTSRRPPAVPRALGEPIGSTATAREAAVIALLEAPILPLELVRKLAWPRLEVFSVVRALTRSARLDTPRAGFARASMGSPWTWSGLPLGEVGERIAARQAERLALAATLVEAIDAIAEPLWDELDPLWKGFVETERFATRAAFGLPDEEEPGQTERFAGELMTLFAALPERARVRLEDLVEGRGGLAIGGGGRAGSPRPAGGELSEWAARRLLGVLMDDARADGRDGGDGEAGEGAAGEVLHRVGARVVLSVLVADRLAVSGRGGPRPTHPGSSRVSARRTRRPGAPGRGRSRAGFGASSAGPPRELRAVVLRCGAD